MINESEELLNRIAADAEGTVFNTNALVELLTRAALEPGEDALARRLHATVYAALVSLRDVRSPLRTPRVRKSVEEAEERKEPEPVKKGEEEEEEEVSYDADEPLPEGTPTVKKEILRRGGVKGGQYLPAFYDQLGCYLRSPRRSKS
jgi:hypothetical protein